MSGVIEMDLIEDKSIETSEKVVSREEISSILELKGKERMDAILNHDNAQYIVQSLPEEEVYFTIKEIGEQDALPLISLMSPEQYQYLLDLELWKGYELKPERVEHWLPILLSCEEDAIERWLKTVDLDTLLLILKKNIRIHIKNGDEPLDFKDEENYPFTLDGTYYIEVLNPKFRDYIEKLLNHIASLDFNFYLRLLDQVSWEIGVELEERAFRFREARLADKGFPSFDEALSLYQYLNPKRLRLMLEEKKIHPVEIPNDSLPPNFPMLLKEQRMFFSICLSELDDQYLLDRIKTELTYMANQALVVDQPENIDLTVLKESLKKVGSYLSIGLEIMSGGDISQAKRYLSEIPLKYLFQIGFGSALELKWKAERILKKGWYSNKGLPLSFLGFPWEERMEGVLRKRPLFFSETDEMGYREFRRLEEIRLVEHELALIEFLMKILPYIEFNYYDGLIWKTVLINAFITDQMGISPDIQNIDLRDRTFLLSRLNDDMDLKETITNWIFNKFHFIKNNGKMELTVEIAKILSEEIITEKNVIKSCKEDTQCRPVTQ